MSEDNLQNLVKIGQLKAENFSRSEFDGLVKSAKKRLADARNETLSPESRFDLAYNASHAFALGVTAEGLSAAKEPLHRLSNT